MLLVLFICDVCDVSRFWSLRFAVMFWFVDLVMLVCLCLCGFILVCSVLFELC